MPQLTQLPSARSSFFSAPFSATSCLSWEAPASAQGCDSCRPCSKNLRAKSVTGAQKRRERGETGETGAACARRCVRLRWPCATSATGSQRGVRASKVAAGLRGKPGDKHQGSRFKRTLRVTRRPTRRPLLHSGSSSAEWLDLRKSAGAFRQDVGAVGHEHVDARNPWARRAYAHGHCERKEARSRSCKVSPPQPRRGTATPPPLPFLSPVP